MEKIQNKIADFISTGVGDFESLALELFSYQYEKNSPYRAFCELQRKTPQTIAHWSKIPAVSVGAFKSAELVTFPVRQAAAHFESSGTTQDVRSHHYLKTLSYYEASVQATFPHAFLPDQAKLPFLILNPSPAEAPRSSLTWMMDVVKRRFGQAGSGYMVRNGRLDEPWLTTLLQKSESEKQPVALLGTTIAFARYFDFLMREKKRFRLPEGSRLFDTGGMKTEKRELSRPDFIRQVQEFLGVPEGDCVNEYGMCELSSQFYGRGSGSYLEGPAWTRTQVIDPASGEPVGTGRPGLLRHFDLANVDSVLAIQTEDLAIAEGKGFIFQGRDPLADVKGCSLAAETFAP